MTLSRPPAARRSPPAHRRRRCTRVGACARAIRSRAARRPRDRASARIGNARTAGTGRRAFRRCDARRAPRPGNDRDARDHVERVLAHRSASGAQDGDALDAIALRAMTLQADQRETPARAPRPVTLSMRSSMPPCPGTSAAVLEAGGALQACSSVRIADDRERRHRDAGHRRTARRPPSNSQCRATPGDSAAREHAADAPSQVFLGDTRGASGTRPNHRPAKNAPVSAGPAPARA